MERFHLSHPAIQALYVTNSIALPPPHWSQLHVVSIAPLLAGAIRRLFGGRAWKEL